MYQCRSRVCSHVQSLLEVLVLDTELKHGLQSKELDKEMIDFFGSPLPLINPGVEP